MFQRHPTRKGFETPTLSLLFLALLWFSLSINATKVRSSCRSKATEVVIPRNDPYMANGPRTMKRTVNRTSNKELQIGTWNTRTMLQKGKLEDLKLEMNRYMTNILGVAEVRWKDKGDFLSEDKRVIYSGGERAG